MKTLGTRETKRPTLPTFLSPAKHCRDLFFLCFVFLSFLPLTDRFRIYTSVHHMLSMFHVCSWSSLLPHYKIPFGGRWSAMCEVEQYFWSKGFCSVELWTHFSLRVALSCGALPLDSVTFQRHPPQTLHSYHSRVWTLSLHPIWRLSMASNFNDFPRFPWDVWTDYCSHMLTTPPSSKRHTSNTHTFHQWQVAVDLVPSHLGAFHLWGACVSQINRRQQDNTYWGASRGHAHPQQNRIIIRKVVERAILFCNCLLRSKL